MGTAIEAGPRALQGLRTPTEWELPDLALKEGSLAREGLKRLVFGRIGEERQGAALALIDGLDGPAAERFFKSVNAVRKALNDDDAVAARYVDPVLTISAKASHMATGGDRPGMSAFVEAVIAGLDGLKLQGTQAERAAKILEIIESMPDSIAGAAANRPGGADESGEDDARVRRAKAWDKLSGRQERVRRREDDARALEKQQQLDMSRRRQRTESEAASALSEEDLVQRLGVNEEDAGALAVAVMQSAEMRALISGSGRARSHEGHVLAVAETVAERHRMRGKAKGAAARPGSSEETLTE
jgi:hypothetical protein